MMRNGHNALTNYLDDLIYRGLPSSTQAPYDFLLLQELGLKINTKKLHAPDT